MTAGSTARPAAEAGLFHDLEPQAPDSLLALIGLHRADPRPDKIDVGVGVYRDADGRTPVFAAVKAAEEKLLREQPSKSYLGPEGDTRFTRLLADIVFGPQLADAPGLTGIQTPGGTGALRLGAELAVRAKVAPRIWIGTPTWINHVPLFAAAGFDIRQHRFFDHAVSGLDFPAMMEDLQAAEPGDLILLHGCCHNPTGISFSREQWRMIAEFVAARGLIPFVDLAYQGLGAGLDDDAAGLRYLLGQVREAFIAYSCDKNFGLYRERVGALWVWTSNGVSARLVQNNLCALARINWSMPPDHGAATVRTILDEPVLRATWLAELAEMRTRIDGLRKRLAAGHRRLLPVGNQEGMFAMLPLSGAAVAALREEHGIYMAPNGRINIAGLGENNVARFIDAVGGHLEESE